MKGLKRFSAGLCAFMMVFGSIPAAAEDICAVPAETHSAADGSVASAEDHGDISPDIITRDDQTDGAYKYVVIGDKARVTGYTGTDTAVSVPSALGGYTVAEIGDGAFTNIPLTSISLPDKLEKIGNNAFNGCTGLTSVTIPDNVTDIGVNSFKGCTSLASVTLPASLKNIESGAFDGCTALGTINYNGSKSGWRNVNVDPDSGIGGTAVIKCTDGDYVYDPAAADYELKEITAASAEIARYIGSGTDVEVPAAINGYNITGIGSGAFSDNKNLTSVTLPDGITYIGGNAFESCSGLTSVNIPASVESIGDYAFNLCTGLSAVSLPAGLKSIGGNAFAQCTSLTAVTVPAGVTSIGVNAFRGCSSLSSIDVDASNTRYSSSDGILYNKTGTDLISCPDAKTSVTIAAGTSVIKANAFDNCIKLSSADIPSGVTTIENSAFDGCEGLTSVTLPDTLRSIGSRAFAKCTRLTSVSIPEGTAAIGARALEGCTRLARADIPSSAGSLGADMFSSCPALADIYYNGTKTAWNALPGVSGAGITDKTTIHFSDGTSEKGGSTSDPEPAVSGSYTTAALSDGTLRITKYNGSEADVEIPSVIDGKTVTSIGGDAFDGKTSLRTVSIPQTVTEIEDLPFENCPNLTEINAAAANPVYSSYDGALYNRNGSKLLMCPEGKSTISFPSGMLSIGKNAFKNCSSFTSLTLPSSLENIEENAFSGCSGLTGIRIPSKVNYISPTAFKETPNLTDIDVVDSNPYYASEGGLLYNNSLTRLIACPNAAAQAVLPSTVSDIGTAFADCRNIEKLTLPDKVTEIKDGAFSGCSSLGNITIPKSAASVGTNSFSGCTALSDIYYGGKTSEWKALVSGVNTAVPSSTVIHCTDGDIGSSDPAQDPFTVTELDDGTLMITDYSGSDEELVIPSSIGGKTVTAIGRSAFYSKPALRSVTIPSTVNDIGNQPFEKCPVLRAINVDEGNSDYASYDGVLYNKNLSKLLQCPAGKSTISYPPRVLSIGVKAFSDCTNFIELPLPDTLENIDDNAFAGCSGLTGIRIPANVNYVSDTAFAQTPNLEEISVAAGNPNYRARFGLLYSYDLTRLVCCPNAADEASLPDTVTDIGTAFASCHELALVEIPDGVKRIRDGAFENCTGLTAVIIPENITRIGQDAFTGCRRLKDIYYRGTAGEWADIVMDEPTGITSDITVHYADDAIVGRRTMSPSVRSDGTVEFSLENVPEVLERLKSSPDVPIYYDIVLYSDNGTVGTLKSSITFKKYVDPTLALRSDLDLSFKNIFDYINDVNKTSYMTEDVIEIPEGDYKVFITVNVDPFASQRYTSLDYADFHYDGFTAENLPNPTVSVTQYTKPSAGSGISSCVIDLTDVPADAERILFRASGNGYIMSSSGSTLNYFELIRDSKNDTWWYYIDSDGKETYTNERSVFLDVAGYDGIIVSTLYPDGNGFKASYKSGRSTYLSWDADMRYNARSGLLEWKDVDSSVFMDRSSGTAAVYYYSLNDSTGERIMTYRTSLDYTSSGYERKKAVIPAMTAVEILSNPENEAYENIAADTYTITDMRAQVKDGRYMYDPGENVKFTFAGTSAGAPVTKTGSTPPDAYVTKGTYSKLTGVTSYTFSAESDDDAAAYIVSLTGKDSSMNNPGYLWFEPGQTLTVDLTEFGRARFCSVYADGSVSPWTGSVTPENKFSSGVRFKLPGNNTYTTAYTLQEAFDAIRKTGVTYSEPITVEIAKLPTKENNFIFPENTKGGLILEALDDGAINYGGTFISPATSLEIKAPIVGNTQPVSIIVPDDTTLVLSHENSFGSIMGRDIYTSRLEVNANVTVKGLQKLENTEINSKLIVSGAINTGRITGNLIINTSDAVEIADLHDADVTVYTTGYNTSEGIYGMPRITLGTISSGDGTVDFKVVDSSGKAVSFPRNNILMYSKTDDTSFVSGINLLNTDKNGNPLSAYAYKKEIRAGYEDSLLTNFGTGNYPDFATAFEAISSYDNPYGNYEIVVNKNTAIPDKFVLPKIAGKITISGMNSDYSDTILDIGKVTSLTTNYDLEFTDITLKSSKPVTIRCRNFVLDNACMMNGTVKGSTIRATGSVAIDDCDVPEGFNIISGKSTQEFTIDNSDIEITKLTGFGKAYINSDITIGSQLKPVSLILNGTLTLKSKAVVTVTDIDARGPSRIIFNGSIKPITYRKALFDRGEIVLEYNGYYTNIAGKQVLALKNADGSYSMFAIDDDNYIFSPDRTGKKIKLVRTW